jgi:hypothetical protein
LKKAGKGDSGMPEEEPDQIQINVVWPEDSFVEAEPTNVFVFSDMGDAICIAFGFVPPPPALRELAKGGPYRTTVARKRAFIIPKSMVLSLRDEINKVVRANPNMWGQSAETNEAGHAPDPS